MEIRKIKYEDLPSNVRKLVEMAKAACANSYAPYSGFHVGAAVLLADGQIYTGANQENAAYGQCLCAERVAVLYAAAQNPTIAPLIIAVAAESKGRFTEEPVSPCGACRQVLCEMERRHNSNLQIVMYGSRECAVTESADSLMPLPFG